MWLLKTSLGEDGNFLPVLEEHEGQNLPAYAILSHTWGEEEVLFSDVVPDCFKALTKKSFAKVEKAAERARCDGHEYIWIDTCCIKKESSAELQEAINSMYTWYARAVVCYAYLADFEDPPDPDQNPAFCVAMRKCRWFTRGWCLQELLAPLNVTFFSANWMEIGTKVSLADLIASITLIDTEYLLFTEPIKTASVAKRMSWASHRQTRRVEDTAYCLMGIFSINMPMLYGEGEKAFLRLQQEIWKEHEDQSLFLWIDPDMDPDTPHGLLANSPAVFRNTGHYRPYDHNQGKSVVEVVSKGVRTTTRVQEVDADCLLASCECLFESGDNGRFTAGVLLKAHVLGVNQYMRVHCNWIGKLPEAAKDVESMFIPQQTSWKKIEQAHYPLDVLFLRHNLECSGEGPFIFADMFVCNKSGQEFVSRIKDDHNVHGRLPTEIQRRADNIEAWIFAPFSSLVEDFERRKLLVVLLFRRRADKQHFAIVLTTDHRFQLAADAFETSATKLEVCSAHPLQLKSCPSISAEKMTSLPAEFHLQGRRVKLRSQTIFSESCKCLNIDFFLQGNDGQEISQPRGLQTVTDTGPLTLQDNETVPKISVQFNEMILSIAWHCRRSVKSMALSRDGISITYIDGRDSVWVISKAGAVRILDVPGALSASFLDDEEVAIVGKDGLLYHRNSIRSTSTQRLLLRDNKRLSFTLAVFSSDGRRIFTQEDLAPHFYVNIWDTASGQLLRTFGRKLGAIRSATFSPDGDQIGLMSMGSCTIVDSTTGARCLTLAGRWQETACLSFSPNGKLIATAEERFLQLWDRVTGSPRGWIDMNKDVRHIAFSPSGNCVTAVPTLGKPFFGYLPEDMCAGPAAKFPTHQDRSAAFSRDGKQIAFGSRSTMFVEIYRYSSEKGNKTKGEGNETKPLKGHRALTGWNLFKRKERGYR